MSLRIARTPHLEIAFDERNSNAGGEPVVLVHGFPDDARSWDAVPARPDLSARRTLAPFVRGYGPTRFRSATTMRSGETAALALFPAGYERRLFEGVGHFLQREVPDIVAATVGAA